MTQRKSLCASYFRILSSGRGESDRLRDCRYEVADGIASSSEEIIIMYTVCSANTPIISKLFAPVIGRCSLARGFSRRRFAVTFRREEGSRPNCSSPREVKKH